ncbi:MAG: prepilin peptidase [Acidocella sp.]|nr:prepilin peptidase [Acidocella sp.]
MNPEFFLPAAVLLVYAALHDLAVRTVPNWLSAVLFAIGVCARLLDHSLLAGLIAAGIAFAVLFAVWVKGAMGGGDVKLWVATVLLVPPFWQLQLSFFLDVVVLGGVLALIYLLLSLFVPRPHASRAGGRLKRFLRAELWRIGRRAPLPYACAIAGGALATLLPHALQL